MTEISFQLSTLVTHQNERNGFQLTASYFSQCQIHHKTDASYAAMMSVMWCKQWWQHHANLSYIKIRQLVIDWQSLASADAGNYAEIPKQVMAWWRSHNSVNNDCNIMLFTYISHTSKSNMWLLADSLSWFSWHQQLCHDVDARNDAMTLAP